MTVASRYRVSSVPGTAWFCRIIMGLVLAITVAANDSGARSDAPFGLRESDHIDNAIERSLVWLLTRQDPQTGKFNDPMPNTMTGLTSMALMASGRTPDDSTQGSALRTGVLFLADKGADETGYFGGRNNENMYSHGICTLALADAYGMLPTLDENRRVRNALQKAISVIIKAQSTSQGQHHGGWRYNTHDRDADLSVSTWQILALSAARDCGIPVPDQVMHDAAEYVRRCYNPRDKAFTYNGSNASPAMRAAGVTAMLALGRNQTEADQVKIRYSSSFLLNFDPSAGKHFYYQAYYVSMAATLLGEKYELQIRPRLENTLLRLQQADGSFQEPQSAHGQVFASAMAIIALSSRNRVLPIYGK